MTDWDELEIESRIALIEDYLVGMNDALPPGYELVRGFPKPTGAVFAARRKGNESRLYVSALWDGDWESEKERIKEDVLNAFAKLERNWLELGINGYEEANRP